MAAIERNFRNLHTMNVYISQNNSTYSIYFTGPKTHSRLIVSDVIKEDSGNYTCSAPSTVSSSIDVFVSPGKFLQGVLTIYSLHFSYPDFL